MAKKTVSDVLASRIIEALEQDIVPWRKPWVNRGGQASRSTLNPYRGINALNLELVASMSGYKSRYWITYKQCESYPCPQCGYKYGEDDYIHYETKSGAKRKKARPDCPECMAPRPSVKKGESGTPVRFVKTRKQVEDKENPGEKIWVSTFFERYYTVFNLDQTIGIPEPPESKELPGSDLEPNERAQAVLDGTPNPPKWTHNGSRACYTPALDTIGIPELGQFNSVHGYYSTAFHELAHATGHPSRLNRFGENEFVGFGSEPYAEEELVAELTACLLNGQTGIENPEQFEQNAAYIKNWLETLKNDTSLIVKAASKAQKAVDYINGTTFDNGEDK